MKSWKTTAAGGGALLATIGATLNQLTDGNPATNPDWNIVLPLLFTGFIGIFARDNNVPSEAIPKAVEKQSELASVPIRKP